MRPITRHHQRLPLGYIIMRNIVIFLLQIGLTCVIANFCHGANRNDTFDGKICVVDVQISVVCGKSGSQWVKVVSRIRKGKDELWPWRKCVVDEIFRPALQKVKLHYRCIRKQHKISNKPYVLAKQITIPWCLGVCKCHDYHICGFLNPIIMLTIVPRCDRIRESWNNGITTTSVE